MMCFIPLLNLEIDKIDKLFYQKILKGIFFTYILLPVIVKCLWNEQAILHFQMF